MLKKRLKDLYEEKIIGSYLKRFHYDLKSNFKSDDVFIVGYPKSGNTWMQNLMAGLLFGIDTRYLPDKLTQELIPPVKNRRFFKRFLDFNCFKSHELPQKEYRKVILLVRDGRDVIPSYKAMNDKMGKHYSFEEMIEGGKGLYPCKWHQFYEKWEQNPFKSKILICKYENLLKDGFSEMKRILNFLEIEREDKIILKTLAGNEFQKMKEKKKKFGMDGHSLTPNQEFFRLGKAGGFRESVPQELIQKFEYQSKKILSLYEYL